MIRLLKLLNLIPYLFAFTASTIGFSVGSAMAADDFDSLSFQLRNTPACQPDWIIPRIPVPEPDSQPTVSADQLKQPDALQYELTGQVVLKQPGLVVFSDQAALNREMQTAEAFGSVQLHRPTLLMTSDHIWLDDRQKTAKLQNARYQFIANRAHGTANTIFMNQTKQQSTLNQATYTTCPLVTTLWQTRDKTIESAQTLDWQLNFNELKIDNQAKRIYGYHTLLYFHQLPVFYTPYINFSMEKRASGLLFPTFGSYKSILHPDRSREVYVNIPYYFNIAENMDDTLSVMKMQDRGWVVENEFRYLQPNHAAELTLTGLNDKVTQQEGLSYANSQKEMVYQQPVSERWRAKLIARQNWGAGLTSNIHWHQVSDRYFFADIPVETTLDTVTYTQRTAHLQFQQENLQARLELFDYLRLRADAPYNYEKRPHFSLNYAKPIENERWQNFSFNLAAEATEFQISSSGHNKPEGRRTVVTPSARYQVLKPYGQFKTELLAHQVNYTLHANTALPEPEELPALQVPQFVMRGGLIFERDFSLANTNMTQTLEPDIQYLYTPYQPQNEQPLFDTVASSLDFTNLFATNRYSGLDRFGDSNQIAAALTTRFLFADGRPFAELGAGQIFYLADRKVTLKNSPTELIHNQHKRSDYFIKTGLETGPIKIAATAQLNEHNFGITQSNSRLKLNINNQLTFLSTHILTLRNQPGENEDLTAGLHWQMTPHWSVGGYINYNFTQNIKKETQTALRYDSCCWSSEISLKETKLLEGLYNYSLQFVIEFKGLSSVGTPFKEFLQHKLNF